MRSAMQFARFSVVLSLVTLIVTFADFRWLAERGAQRRKEEAGSESDYL